MEPLALPSVGGLPVAATVLVARDPAGVAAGAAERMAAWVEDALADRPLAHVALTGGSSAGYLWTELHRPTWLDALPWDRVHLWWGDERFVPADSPDSNYGTARDAVLGPDALGARLPVENVHPIPVDTALADGREATWAARAYAAELATLLPRRAAIPAFDLIMLGLGPDGHVLSVFPGSPALEPDTPIVMAVPAPTHVTPHVARVTLNPSLIPAAAHVLVLAGGAAKADVVRRVLTGTDDPSHLPGRLGCGPNATWILDRESAGDLVAA
jgi:6-phosphogluconolactonase